MRSASSRTWSLAAVAGLVILNVVLIAVLVLRPGAPTPSDPEATAAAPSPSVTATMEGEPEKASPSQAQMPTPEASEEKSAPAGGPTERLLVNVNASIAWRGTVGSCSEPGTLEYTSDGGRTWSERPMELAPLQRLRVLGTETLFAIGGAEECEPTYISSYSSGISWSTNDDLLAGSWYLDPADRTVVATPLGDVDAPCEAVDLAGVDADNAAILCTNGDLAVSSDGGASWQGVDVDGAARAIGIADDGYVLAGEEESCEEGVAVSTLDVTGAGMELDCMAAGLDDATELAVSGAGGAIWLWAEDEVVVSG